MRDFVAAGRSWYSEKVLVEERGSSVPWGMIPANSGALGERGNLAEIAEPGSRRCGWGATVKTCPLSSISIGKWVERYREVVKYCPPCCFSQPLLP